jgi:predicted transcriptional regulator with HTH domain
MEGGRTIQLGNQIREMQHADHTEMSRIIRKHLFLFFDIYARNMLVSAISQHNRAVNNVLGSLFALATTLEPVRFDMFAKLCR